ncbi:MAG: hypothetical protein QM730_04090 [Anaerolineales bacterium]
MNTTQYAQGISSVNFSKWLWATILFVAIGVFLTLLVGGGAIVLCLMTSLFTCWTQIVIIQEAVPVQVSRWLLYLLFGSMVGWSISFLLIYLLDQPMETLINSAFNTGHWGSLIWSAVWIGFFTGGSIGLFPGIFIGLAYWWLTRPDDNGKRLFLNNVIGWCVGMGLASVGMFMLLTIMLSNMTIF